jgi:hypothetical protein
MKVKLSRRQVIAAGGAALAAPIILSGEHRAEAQNTQFSAADRSIASVSGADAAFGPNVESLFPGLMSDPTFQKIAPLALLITHLNGPAVRAFSTSYLLSTPSGTYQTGFYSYVTPGPALQGRSPSTLGSARRPILQAGQSRLFTPFFNWTPTYYQANPNPSWDEVLVSVEPGSFLASQLTTLSSVIVSLDGVVFSDWKIMGPDNNNLTRHLRSRKNAEHDEALVVQRLVSANASDNVIVETLLSDASTPNPNKPTLPGQWYSRFRKFQAQVLLQAFNNADRDTFNKAIARLVRQGQTVITRVAL